MSEYIKKFKQNTSKAHMKTVLEKMGISFSESNLVEIYDSLQEDGSIKEYFACKRKNRYTTMNAATRGAYHEDVRHKGTKTWFPYKCIYNCPFYHVGSRVAGRKYESDSDFDND